MSRGATRITDMDGEEMFHPINMDRLQKTTLKKNNNKIKAC